MKFFIAIIALIVPLTITPAQADDYISSQFPGDIFKHKTMSEPSSAMFRDGAYNDLSNQPDYIIMPRYRSATIPHRYAIYPRAIPCKNHGYHISHRKVRIY